MRCISTRYLKPTSLYLIKSPYILKKLSHKWIHWDIKDTANSIFLTFDDGPIPDITPKVLSLLKEYDAKASFFMVGENAKRYPEIYKQVLAEGHVVGNHTYNHLKGFSISNSDYYTNIAEAGKFIDSKLFRPPHGQITPAQIRHISGEYTIVMWSVLSGDFDSKISPEICTENVIHNTQSGSIVVFHDSLKAEHNMLPTLKNTLEYFSQKGFKFNSLYNL